VCWLTIFGKTKIRGNAAFLHFLKNYHALIKKFSSVNSNTYLSMSRQQLIGVVSIINVRSTHHGKMQPINQPELPAHSNPTAAMKVS
jgi:hypothetical protein